jgi:hypothetical protein
MFRRYQNAETCYADLSDVSNDQKPRDDGSAFSSSRWFQRGWTLQELLAPKRVEFFGLAWQKLGTKVERAPTIERITGIPQLFIRKVIGLPSASVAQRMSWAAKRDTTRKGDTAYCLLGIFGIMMPMIYGKGGNQAFFRLQEQKYTEGKRSLHSRIWPQLPSRWRIHS